MTTLAWFDAVAPYHPTTIGIYTQVQCRLTQNTNRNKNIAIFYAGYHIGLNHLAKRKKQFDQMMIGVGLDPSIQSSDLTTPQGLGIVAAKNVIANWVKDGMNQLGEKSSKYENRAYNKLPYFDYTRYSPVNTAYELKDPNQWQPNVVTQQNGLFKVQQFVTPQYGEVTPISYKDANFYKAAKPVKSMVQNWGDYQAQAKIVLEESANLSLDKKLKAQFFDSKFISLGVPLIFLTDKRNMSLIQFVHVQAASNLAGFDTGIAIWNQKKRYDTVRPFSAIKFIWGNRTVSAWGGPGKGTVSDLPASEWRSYLDVADHPQYPSGSAAFCSTIVTVSRLIFGDDKLGYSHQLVKGSSYVEPGITPPQNTTIKFDTWSQFLEDCGNSRVWGGVHFPDAVDAGRLIGKQIGRCAYNFIKAHVYGTYVPFNQDPNCKY